jgi:hypothetical protein
MHYHSSKVSLHAARHFHSDFSEQALKVMYAYFKTVHANQGLQSTYIQQSLRTYVTVPFYNKKFTAFS